MNVFPKMYRYLFSGELSPLKVSIYQPEYAADIRTCIVLKKPQLSATADFNC